MSPEYASEGIYSIKSDVFIFGVLLLEILSGKGNSGFYQYGDFLNLIGYVCLFYTLVCTVMLFFQWTYSLYHVYACDEDTFSLSVVMATMGRRNMD